MKRLIRETVIQGFVPKNFTLSSPEPEWQIRLDIFNGKKRKLAYCEGRSKELLQKIKNGMLKMLYDDMKAQGWSYSDLKKLPLIKGAKISRYISFPKGIR